MLEHVEGGAEWARVLISTLYLSASVAISWYIHKKLED